MAKKKPRFDSSFAGRFVDLAHVVEANLYKVSKSAYKDGADIDRFYQIQMKLHDLLLQNEQAISMIFKNKTESKE